MRTIHYILGICCTLLLGYPCASFAQDTTFNRVVTVEREYQPDIHQAEMIPVQPSILQVDVNPNPVVYSTYSNPLSIGFNLHPLKAAETRFTPPTQLGGIIDGAAGYRNTHLHFAYRLREKKNWSVDVFAKHDAYWGKDALSVSGLGTTATRHFKGLDLYVGVDGKNEAYAYQPVFGWQTLWNANTKIGIRSTRDAAIQYRVQTGYEAFITTNYAVEHQVCSYLDFAWKGDKHQAGLHAYVQNSIYSVADTAVAPRHAIRMEPFYEFETDYLRVHAGVHIDMNIGNGTYLSSTPNLAFAPSPHIEVEGHVLNNLLHPYLHAQGGVDMGTMEEYMGYNRFLSISGGLQRELRNYTPADVQLGIKIRPLNTMLLDIYGGYAYMIGACNMEAVLNDANVVTNYHLWFTNYQRWKVGASLHYHYRDIVELNIGGNYYFYLQDPIPSMDPTEPYFQENRVKGTNIFDRPNWDAYARIEAHIDSKWSIYSDNYLVGSRQAYVAPYRSATLRPIISLSLGGQYAINRWLVVYAQLNDYLNRKDSFFYGYESQGIHFLVGVKYKF